ncbi:MAG TPA: PAS domain S-box protein [Puia sp.]|jgi:PAS domain S-box-containing protein|nr:PAS domain S-box protein [Puia sp.]
MQKINNGLVILTVEDNPSDLFLLEHMLRSSGLDIRQLYSTDTIGEAYRLLREWEIDLVLLDLSLPDSWGIHTFVQLKPAVQRIPVIILTGLSDMKVALEAIKEGAQDYLVKNELTEGLLAKTIQYSLERKRNLEYLRESNERFNTVVKATNDAIWDWDIAGGKLSIIGDTYQQLFGHDRTGAASPEELWEEVMHPDDKERVFSKLQRVIREGVANKWEDEYRLRRAAGEYAHVHDRGYIIHSTGPVRMIGAIQDITARKRSEEIILASEERYRQLFYKNPFPTWIFDPDNLQIMEVNDEAREKYGFTREEFNRLTMRDLHAPGEAEQFMADLQQNGSAKLAAGVRLWHHHNKWGRVMIVEITSHPMDYFGKACVQVIVNDVTERIRLEKELALQQKLKQQQITEVVLGAQERERFELGQELHDNINQILATSKLYLDVAIEEKEPQLELLAKSRKNISMAIEEIRKLSKDLIAPSLNDLGLTQSIKELIRSIQSVGKMKIRLNISGLCEEELLPEQKINIYRIIQEQLNNILKHAQAGTVVIELNKVKEQVRLRLADDGKGFDPRMRRKGVGISNIISRAELYNGKVEIESAPGKGCQLVVVLNSKALVDGEATKP